MASDQSGTTATREARLWGVVAAANMSTAAASTDAQRDRIMAQAVGLLHGTMGEGRK